MKMAVFWDVAPCSLVEIYRRFRGSCCLHHQGDNPEDSHLYTRRRENLKSITYMFIFLFPTNLMKDLNSKVYRN
jgi:hypothetical protein